MTPVVDLEITDYAAAVFLRYYLRAEFAETKAPRIDRSRDVAHLREHWSISKPVREFLSYLLSHRHEAQSLLRARRHTDDAVVRGRIDARDTKVAQLMSGNSSLVVSNELVRSFNTGPNQVVAWVVHTASTHVSRLFKRHSPESPYAGLIRAAMRDIAAVTRLEAFREPMRHVASNRRPELGALRSAARSRQVIYQRAIEAYTLLMGVEAGEEKALLSVLDSTLIAPVEPWRRLELAVAVGIGESLAEETGQDMHLSLIGGQQKRHGDDHPIIQCGRFEIYWQSGRVHFSAPVPEPSDIRLRTILEAYGMRFSDGRPDLLIVDRDTSRVISVVEVKYHGGDTAVERFREAAGQVVRYARGYSDEAHVDHLINRSLIALSMDAPRPDQGSAPTVCAVDFPQIQRGALRGWVRDRLLGPSC